MADNELAAALAKFTDRVLRWTAQSMEDLTQDEVHFRTLRRPELHRVRSLAHRTYCRQPDSLRFRARAADLDVRRTCFEAWGLPKVDQGTGTSIRRGFELGLPGRRKEIAGYLNDVADVIVPRIEGHERRSTCNSITRIVPQGELPKWQIIGQVIINHSNNHLGQINVGRTMQGKDGLGF